MHTNLFSNGHSRREVRDAMVQDHKRDSGTIRAHDAVLFACLVFLVRNQPWTDAVAIVIAAAAGVSGLRYFVDQSVRNFYLHRIDWDAAPSDEPGE